ncbi:MAG: hypothetical protein JXR73_15525 [Candidatus Omnitrophica bacterium]|nr:hypothetical protein [Candidatus Omnitrophota bacterium]
MRSILLFACFAGIFLYVCAVQTSAEDIAGERITLSTGELIIPSYFQPRDGEIDLVFHLHCAPEAAGKSLIRSGVNAVMIAVHLGSFSSPYQHYFSDANHFFELLDQSLDLLKKRHSDPSLRWGRLCVSAFSGGYGGAREFVRIPKIYERIDSLILLDCPHTSYTEDKRVNPDQMEGFMRYAQDAVLRKKTFIMTHSEIAPGAYASTTECADYLIAGVKGKRTPWSGINPMDMIRQSRFEAGRFKVYGYQGETAADHMKHLHGLFLFLTQIDFEQRFAADRPDDCMKD